jgi:hypothetical protein
VFDGDDLVSYILFDIYRKMCDSGLDEFINIMNHAEPESSTHFIKCELKSVGLDGTKIPNNGKRN